MDTLVLNKEPMTETIEQSGNCAKTPKKIKISETVVTLNDNAKTPRRSTRKSVKPLQDYDEIINKSSLRSGGKSIGKLQMTSEEYSEEDDREEENFIQHKWTPGEVGRSSQKRKRKIRRNTKDTPRKNLLNIEKDNELTTTLLCDGIQPLPEESEIIESDGRDKSDTDKQNDMVVDGDTEIKSLDATFEVEEISEGNNECIGEVQSGQFEIGDRECGKIQTSVKNVNNEEDILIDETVIEEEKKEEKQNELCENPLTQAIQHHVQAINIERKETSTIENCLNEAETIATNDVIDLCTPIHINNATVHMKSSIVANNKCILFPNIEEETEDEMPSLIVCDDDEDGEMENRSINEKKENQYETVFGSDGVITAEENDASPSVVEQTLRINNENTPQETLPRIVLTTAEGLTHTLLPSPPKKTPRTSTPFRNKLKSRLDISKKEITDIDEEELGMETKSETYESTSTIVVVNDIQPKSIIMHNRRKRSLSTDSQLMKNSNILQKRQKMVSFHSPANQTTIIDDLDLKITESVKKFKSQETQNSKMVRCQKRSLSLDDSVMNSQVSKIPRAVQTTPNKLNKTVGSTHKASRTKLPNFAAIHQKQFQKMENLVDHMARKQERCKKLLNSITKPLSSSTQNLMFAAAKDPNVNDKKPKALKKLDLSGNQNCKLVGDRRQQEDKKQDTNVAVIKPLLQSNVTIRKADIVINKPQASTSNASVKLGMATSKASDASSSGSNTNKREAADKMTQRLQRHMSLFKGRMHNGGRDPNTNKESSRTTETIIRGVRSNRRFELQMQHRKNLQQ